MAATITLSAPVVAADGRTMTATIGGGSGSGYAISGTAGLMPHRTDDFGFVVSGATVSGTTLTMTLGSTIGTGEAIRLDVTTAAPITDSAANTPVGQTNVVATNNSAVAVQHILVGDNPDLFEINAYTSNDTVREGWFGALIDNWPVEFVTDAAEVSILGYSGAQQTVRVDGSTTDVPAPPSNGFWVIRPVTAGLTGLHLYRVSGDYTQGVRIVGGAIRTVSTAKAPIITNTRNYRGIPNESPAALRGAYRNDDNSQVAVGSYGGFSLEIGFTGSGLELHTVASHFSGWAAGIDGGRAELLTPGIAAMHNTFQLIPLAAGLSPGDHTITAEVVALGTNTSHGAMKVINGTKTTGAVTVGATTLTVATVATLAVGAWVKIDYYSNREWRQITAINGTTITLGSALDKAHAAGVAVTSYTAPKGSFTPWRSRPAPTKRLAAMGDSNTQGSNEYGAQNIPDAAGNYYSWYDPRVPPMRLAADQLNIDVFNFGIQGTSTLEMAQRSGVFDSLSHGVSYDYITVWPGTNDINGNTATPTEYQTQVEQIVVAAEAKLAAGGRIILMAPFTPRGVTSAKGLSYVTALAAMQAVAASHPAVVVPTDLFDGLVAGIDHDQLHYTTIGRAKVAAKLAPYLGAPVGVPAVGGAVAAVGGTLILVS